MESEFTLESRPTFVLIIYLNVKQFPEGFEKQMAYQSRSSGSAQYDNSFFDALTALWLTVSYVSLFFVSIALRRTVYIALCCVASLRVRITRFFFRLPQSTFHSKVPNSIMYAYKKISYEYFSAFLQLSFCSGLFHLRQFCCLTTFIFLARNEQQVIDINPISVARPKTGR